MFFIALIGTFIGRKYPYDCGHESRQKVLVYDYEVKRIVTAKPKGKGYCPQCLIAQKISCGWCKRSIIYGDYVTLYPLIDTVNVEPTMRLYKGELVCCRRKGCANRNDQVSRHYKFTAEHGIIKNQLVNG